jgi:PKD repeat protein
MMCISTNIVAQNNITSYEYWFNEDFDNRVSVPTSPTTSLQLNTSIATGNLPTGLHALYIRFKDANDIWSPAHTQTIVKISNQNVFEYEYWFDENINNRVHVSNVNGTNGVLMLNTSLSANGLTAGFHEFYIRIKNQNGSWSPAMTQNIYVLRSELITGYEYWFDNDFQGRTFFSLPTPSATINFTPSINAANLTNGPHQVYVRFRQGNGLWSPVTSDNINVQVTVIAPTPAFSVTTNALTATFNNQSQNATTYAWDFGDGNTSLATNPIHNYTSAGTYTVKLVASNATGTDSMTQTVTVTSPCFTPTFWQTPAVSSNDATLFIPASINPIANGNPLPIGTLIGLFDDSENLWGLGTWTGSGNLSISAKGNDGSNNGFNNGDTIRIKIQLPTGEISTSTNFVYAPISGIISQMTTYLDGEILGLSTFGATYTPTALATPTANFIYTSNVFTYNFANSSTNAVSYSWDFSDGATSNQTNPIHTFSGVGVYNVCLYATNACGTDTSCQNITISITNPCGNLPVINNVISNNPTACNTPDGTITITATATNSIEFSIDNGLNWQSNGLFTNLNAGNYFPLVKNVADTCAVSANLVTLTAPTTPTIAAFEYLQSGLNIIFKNKSINFNTSQWTFGDGTTNNGNDSIITHTYLNSGTYTICLTTQNVCGDSTICQIISVNKPCDNEITTWSSPIITGENATVIFPTTALMSANGNTIPDGTQIGFFDQQDSLWGVGTYQNGQSFSVAVYGNDGNDEGFQINENFRLKAQLPNGLVSSEVIATFQSPDGVVVSNTNQYIHDGISVVTALMIHFGASDSTFLTSTTCDASQAGYSSQLFTNQYGCDSLVVSDVILTLDTTIIDIYSCDNALIGQVIQFETNQYGCDSMIITNYLDGTTPPMIININTCDITEIGQVIDTFSNQYNCDSLIITNTILDNNANSFSTQTVFTCEINAVGSDTTVFTTPNGCDSIVITNTIAYPNANSISTQTVFTCDINAIGSDTTVFTTPNGCDSIVITNTIAYSNANSISTQTVFTCEINAVGSDTTVFTTPNGCDSIVITNTIAYSNANSISTQTVFTCDVNSVGIDTTIFNTPNDCDSTVITNTIAYPNANNISTQTVFTCEINAVGSDTTVFTTPNGCDSIVITNTIAYPNANNISTQTIFTCDVNSVGIDTTIFNTPNGCDSTVITNTIAYPNTNSISTQTIFTCDINSIGIDTTVFTTPNGCDSIVIKNTIAYPNTNSISTQTVFTCDINAIGSDTTVFTTPNSCDSTVITNTIAYPNMNSISTQTVFVCDLVNIGMDTVTYPSFSGCDSVLVTNYVLSDLVIDSIGSIDADCGAFNGTATAYVTGGTGNYTYSWSNGDTTPTITNLNIGTYSVTVSDDMNCIRTASIYIDLANPLTVNLNKEDVDCHGTASGSIMTIINGGIAPFTYQWSNSNATTNSINNLIAGNYIVTVTDANGCFQINAITISEPTPLIFNSRRISSPTACNTIDGEAEIIPSGGVSLLIVSYGQTGIPIHLS